MLLRLKRREVHFDHISLLPSAEPGSPEVHSFLQLLVLSNSRGFPRLGEAYRLAMGFPVAAGSYEATIEYGRQLSLLDPHRWSKRNNF